MGVRINGVWHEELADPGTGGSDEGAGRNFTSGEQYNQVSSSQPAGFWGENLDTHYDAPSSPGTPTAANPLGTGTGQGADQVGAAIQKMLQAIADGNKQAFDETVREWNLVFGLDTQKFNDDVRRFNENLQLAQAGLTGTYQGQQTQQAQQQAFTQGLQTRQQGFNEQQALAAMYGQAYPTFGAVPQGQLTQAAAQQLYAQQMGLVSAAQTAQANPFRQAQLYGQANQILNGQAMAGFQAPNIVAGVGTAGGNTQGGMGYLQQIIEDIRNPAANQTSADAFLSQTPTPNKLDSVSFMKAAPTAQNLILQAMSEKYGIDPKDALKQIQNTMPQFQAPATVGTVRR